MTGIHIACTHTLHTVSQLGPQTVLNLRGIYLVGFIPRLGVVCGHVLLSFEAC